MTEAEWLECTLPDELVEMANGPGLGPNGLIHPDRDYRGKGKGKGLGERRLRLIACACSRLDIKSPDHLRAVELLEHLADGLIDRGQFQSEVDSHRLSGWTVTQGGNVAGMVGWLMTDGHFVGNRLACDVVRDIVGNPFRPVTISPYKPGRQGRQGRQDWWTPLVEAAAQAAYLERLPDGSLDPGHLGPLHDLLVDAGFPCSGPPARLLGHLKEPGPRFRGCWALDLLLGKN